MSFDDAPNTAPKSGLHQPQAGSETVPEVGDERGLARHSPDRTLYGYSKDDPDPVLVWAKLLGVRTSDIITKGFGLAYLLGGPIDPSDYLVYNHRVLVTPSRRSPQPGRACTNPTTIRDGRNANGRKSSSLPPPDRRLARQTVPRDRARSTLIPCIPPMPSPTTPAKRSSCHICAARSVLATTTKKPSSAPKPPMASSPSPSSTNWASTASPSPPATREGGSGNGSPTKVLPAVRKTAPHWRLLEAAPY